MVTYSSLKQIGKQAHAHKNPNKNLNAKICKFYLRAPSPMPSRSACCAFLGSTLIIRSSSRLPAMLMSSYARSKLCNCDEIRLEMLDRETIMTYSNSLFYCYHSSFIFSEHTVSCLYFCSLSHDLRLSKGIFFCA